LFGVSLDSINTERPVLNSFSHRVSRRSPGRDAAAELHWAGLMNPGPTPLKTAMRGEKTPPPPLPAVSQTRDSFDSSSAFPPLLPLIFSLPFALPTDKNQNSVTQYGGRTSKRLSRDFPLRKSEFTNRTMEKFYLMNINSACSSCYLTFLQNLNINEQII